MAAPRVSVIIPNYNRAGMIGETIANMERQTLTPHEIIVVDDGSSDGSVDFLRSLGDRIRLVVQDNAGPGAARNAGLAIATGDYIQFFDSDDLCTPDKIECQSRALEQSGADIAYGPWIKAWLADGRACYDGLVYQQRPVTSAPLDAFLRGWLLFVPCCVIRRTLLDRVGGYPTATRTAEDLELIVRAMLAGARLVHAPQGMVLVRQHPENQISASRAGAEARRRDRACLFDTIDELLVEGRYVPSSAARRAWRLSAWAFRHEAGLVPDSLMRRLQIRAREARAGFRLRLTGSRLPMSFGPAPMSAKQSEGVRLIGYEPVRH
ncbi:MAG: glycosyltransferase family A protein [Sphingomonas sp.]|jgi:hypothetical protein|uniref:glycosyltransferase family 2 protein n=1 Tax=Sphingomonas sp. TaxID=28214 RepID=UPI0035658922